MQPAAPGQPLASPVDTNPNINRKGMVEKATAIVPSPFLSQPTFYLSFSLLNQTKP